MTGQSGGQAEQGAGDRARPGYRRLAEGQAEQLHAASLEILERVGARFYADEALALFRQGGASVSDGNLVRLPGRLVEWALSVAPRAIALYNQSGRPVLPLTGRRAYFGNGSDLLYIIDRHSRERRRTVLQDAVEAIRLLEVLPGYDFIMSFCLPSDVPVEVAELHQMRVMLDNSFKPIIYVVTDLPALRGVVALAEAAAGGPDALRRRPFAACYINITSPLRHNPESVQKLLFLAERGLPFIYRPSIVTRGVSTPITVAGFLALNNAAQLAGLTLAQLKREGMPFIRCSHGGGTFDMHTMVGQHAAPEARGFNADLAHFYGLPCFGIGGVSGSKTADEQAALESALTLLEAAQSGAQLIHDVGYLDNGLTGSLEQLVICHEIIGWIRQYLWDLTIDAETLALDVIAAVGPDGQFIETEHTLRHVREDWYPGLLARGTYDAWVKDGSRTLRERAAGKVDALLASWAPRAPQPAVTRAWEEITGLGGGGSQS